MAKIATDILKHTVTLNHASQITSSSYLLLVTILKTQNTHITVFLEIMLTSTSFAFSSVTKFSVVDYKQEKRSSRILLIETAA